MASEFANSIADLRHALLVSIRKAIDDFEERTGATPYDIDVQMVDITSINTRTKRYGLSDVKIRFDL